MIIYEIYESDYDTYETKGFSMNPEQAAKMAGVLKCQYKEIDLAKEFLKMDELDKLTKYGDMMYAVRYTMNTGKIAEVRHTSFTEGMVEWFTAESHKLYINVFAANDSEARKKATEIGLKVTQQLKEVSDSHMRYKNFFDHKIYTDK